MELMLARLTTRLLGLIDTGKPEALNAISHEGAYAPELSPESQG